MIHLPSRLSACPSKPIPAGLLPISPLPAHRSIANRFTANPRSAGGGLPGIYLGILSLGLLPLGVLPAAIASTVAAESKALSPNPSLLAMAQTRAPSNGFRYQLGPGDRLRMSVFKMEGYAADVEVLSDGTINLPRIGSLYVWRLTLDQAKEKITKSYTQYLRRPIVYLDLLSSRPIRIAVTGQVQRPGLYSLARGGSGQLATSGDAAGATAISFSGLPTLVDAIQQAGGITAVGDLQDITITRPPNGPNGVQSTLRYNFLNVLRDGGTVENPLIYDGDTITIGRSDEITNEDLITTASSTFAPDTITVNVIGQVDKPGPQQVRSNSPLAQAILAAGGVTRRANVNTVSLIRLQPDGTVKEEVLAYNAKEPMGSANNPPLRSGDVVVVDRHGWAKFNDNLNEAVQPLGPVINAASIFRLFGLN